MRRSAFALAAGIAVVVLTAVAALVGSGQPQDARVAVGLTPSPTTAPTATPTPTVQPTASATAAPTATPTPAAVLDDGFGFAFTSSDSDPSSRRDAVRQESDTRPTHDLADGLGDPRRTVMSNYAVLISYGLAVSPDGRRLAYWTAIVPANGPPLPRELNVLDLGPGARPRTLVTLTQEFGDVAGESVVWSSDGTGLVIGVGTSWFVRGCSIGVPSCPPKYSALYLLEAAGGKPREIASVRGNSLLPVAWDRQQRLVAAFESEGEPGGTVRAYDVIEETGALKRTQMNFGGSGAVIVGASYDAKQVLVHDYAFPGYAVRVWPIASPERAVVLNPRGDVARGADRILAPARWRPGTTEIGVLFADRLELWDAAGARRRVSLPPLPPLQDPPGTPPNRPFFFRIDGSAAFIGRYPFGQTSSYVAVELASGRSAVIPGEDWLSASVRFGPPSTPPPALPGTAPPSPTSPPSPVPTPSATLPRAAVRGTVTSSATGAPVGAVVVRAWRGTVAPQDEAAATRTDPDGRYELQLTPGDYWLSFVPADDSPFAIRWWPGVRDEYFADPISALAGATATADVQLLSGASVTGSVKTAATFMPVAGAQVFLYSVGTTGEPLAVVERATTDGSGRYRIKAANGSYFVAFGAQDPGLEDQWWKGVSWWNTCGVTGNCYVAASQVSIAGADVGGIDAVLLPRFPTTPRTPPQIRGQVVGASGPLARIEVTAYLRTTPVDSVDSPGAMARYCTSPEGAYSLFLPPGSYQIHFRPPSGSPYGAAIEYVEIGATDIVSGRTTTLIPDRTGTRGATWCSV